MTGLQGAQCSCAQAKQTSRHRLVVLATQAVQNLMLLWFLLQAVTVLSCDYATVGYLRLYMLHAAARGHVFTVKGS